MGSSARLTQDLPRISSDFKLTIKTLERLRTKKKDLRLTGCCCASLYSSSSKVELISGWFGPGCVSGEEMQVCLSEEVSIGRGEVR